MSNIQMKPIDVKQYAVMAYAPGDYRLEQVDVPDISDDEMLIKVEGCGICAGDLKAYEGAPSFWGDHEQAAYIKAPMIPGHEFVGHVVKFGKNIRGFNIGDRVISEQIVPCWECLYCNSGKYWMCEKHDVYGFQSNVNGGMASYMKFPKGALIHAVPESLSLEQALLIEPYSCSFHAVERAQIKLGDVVVISGVGTIGLGMVTIAKQLGAKHLIALDLNDERLELAKSFGADIVLNPTKVNVVEEIKKLTQGYGCDIYIEVSGNTSSVKQGLDMIRKLGRFVEVSVFKEKTSVDWSIISDRKELDILGSHLGPYCYERVIEGITSGKLSTEGVVSHKFALKDYLEGFELVKSGKDSLKVILIP